MKNVSVEEFIQILADKQGRVETELGKALAKSCALIQREAMESMRDTQTDPTKAYYTYNKGKLHHPSLPNNPPAVDSGTLRRSITYNVNEKEMYGEVGNLVAKSPYGAYLEFGTSRMKPRPWLKPATEKNKLKIAEFMTFAVKEGIQ